MIEVIKRHLAEQNLLKTAGLSLCYLEKKGEEKCVRAAEAIIQNEVMDCLLYTSPSPRDSSQSRMPSSA